MKRARWVAAVVLVASCVATTRAQSPESGAASTSIVGVVLGPGGKPVAGANVWAATGNQSGSNVATDDRGHFELPDLDRASYRISASAPGLVDDDDTQFAHPGDSVTIRLEKGAVITGKVTDADGAPVVAVPVRAIRTRNAGGKAVAVSGWAPRDTTDDRGVYRIFGLPAGSYLVVAGAATGQDWGRVTSHDSEAPTYYPSSTRDTASTVVVASGQEVTGIDVAYRGGTGHSIVGKVVGSPPKPDTSCTVVVARAGEAEILATVRMEAHSASEDFSFPALSDGDYELRATRYSSEENADYTAPRRVSVRGNDVSGVTLELVPFSTVSGKVVVEKAPADAAPCERPREGAVSEIRMTAVRTGGLPRPAGDSSTSVKKDASFTVPYLRPALYHLDLDLPDARWYVRAITRGEAKPDDPNAKPVDVMVDGLSLSQGQRPSDVRIVVADGAASVAGKIKPSTEGGALPPSARVYLLPANDADAEARSHYYATWALADGTFVVEHVAPGSYVAVVRSEPLDDAGIEPQPAYWDATSRAKLRKEAAKAAPFELARCQSLAGFELAAPATTVRKRAGGSSGRQ